MADVTTVIAPKTTVIPYTGIVEPAVNQTRFARAEVRFTARDEAVAATGGGDNQLLAIRMNLPAGFAYVMTDYTMAIDNAGAGSLTWPSLGYMTTFDALAPANRTVDIQTPITSNGVMKYSSAGEIEVFAPSNLWRGVIIPIETSQTRVQVNHYNTTDAGVAVNIDVAARFLQFDINQAWDTAVNSSIPVR